MTSYASLRHDLQLARPLARWWGSPQTWQRQSLTRVEVFAWVEVLRDV
jgi:hypothetical protein